MVAGGVRHAQVSMSIGLVGVTLSLFLGILLGGISGFYGGVVDSVIQRAIEIIRSIPAIPFWMGLAAFLPRDWSVLQIYFAITIIISVLGWTGLARVVRGRFLALRDEDFVTAAQLSGASRTKTIFRYMLPSFYSHIIAEITLSIPQMIISETALSFLGLGIRPPAVSYGTLLQAAQNVQTVALTPWLMIPAVPVIIAVLAFNFLGDGVRDAADPYAQLRVNARQGPGAAGGGTSRAPAPPQRSRPPRTRSRSAGAGVPPILQVRDLHTHFPVDEGTVVAVDGASFDVPAGRTLGIVGESGCGKSVTARSVLRILDRPGEIVAGEILFRRAPAQRARARFSTWPRSRRTASRCAPSAAAKSRWCSRSRWPRSARCTRSTPSSLKRSGCTGPTPARRKRAPSASRRCARCTSPTPSSASTPTRSSCPAACASAP